MRPLQYLATAVLLPNAALGQDAEPLTNVELRALDYEAGLVWANRNPGNPPTYTRRKLNNEGKEFEPPTCIWYDDIEDDREDERKECYDRPLYSIFRDGYSDSAAAQYNYLRGDPDPLLETSTRPEKKIGTKNWQWLNKGVTQDQFSPRNGHATTVFKCGVMYPVEECIWLTGGKGQEYLAFDLTKTTRLADVYYSKDGRSWLEAADNLEGDFVDGIANFEANYMGGRTSSIAPWYARFGHSLDAMDADGDGINDAMVLAGGYSPEPSNDVWISADGVKWKSDGFAPWPARAWHATTIFKGQLYVVGGAPLSNDVWIGNLITTSEPHPTLNYTMSWSQKLKKMADGTPFAPRAGHCLITQLRRDSWYSTDDSTTDRLFLIGGFSAWPIDDPRYDGERSRNDIYESVDGQYWNKLVPVNKDLNNTKLGMPWAARAWHGCGTFHHPQNRSIDVSAAAHFAFQVDRINNSSNVDPANPMDPRMFIFGGGYTGRKINNIVRKMEGYVDAWSSRDGIHWTQVSYKAYKGAPLYTTQEYAQTGIEDIPHAGKWGFSVEMFKREFDLDGDNRIGGVLDGTTIYDPNVPIERFDFAGTQKKDPAETAFPLTAEFWRETDSVDEKNVPSLFLIGGDFVDEGSLSSQVFGSAPGILCEREGVSCGSIDPESRQYQVSQGVCGPGTMGCICSSRQYYGEFCHLENLNFVSSTWSITAKTWQCAIVFTAALLLAT